MSDAVPPGEASLFLKETLLRRVASEDIESIPDDLPDQSRFLVSAVRAAVRKSCSLCVFVHTRAPVAEGRPHGFEQIYHMQDGRAEIDGYVILTNRDCHNGARRKLSKPTIEAVIGDLDVMGFGPRWTLIWDGENSAATYYPDGTIGDAEHTRYVIEASARTLTQDDVCRALDAAYNNNLKTPGAHTVRLWPDGRLMKRPEDEIERHLKGQLSLYFSPRAKIITQTNTDVGRTDLIFLQRPAAGGSGGPEMVGVLELKVLRGPESKDWLVTKEGLSQGFFYCDDLKLPFATLALYDVGEAPSHEVGPLLADQDRKHVTTVRTRRFPIYRSSKEWRDAGGYTAP